MRAYERLLDYVKVYTTSVEDQEQIPSTEREFDLANQLVDELKALGVADARVDEHCYVYGTIPATPGYEACAAIGFIAHMDTAPDFCGEHVNPQIIENYDGGEVVLGTSGRVLSPKQFPHLPGLKGQTLITTDGTTLLGADDKAGIAEIMTAVEELLAGDRPHGKVCIGFTPDEEVGRGADLFDVKGFGADYAYTVDGGGANEVVYETFNASGAKFEIQGVNIHPGDAKNKMVNASMVALELASMIPRLETPEYTEGYEGYYHLTNMSGSVEKAELDYIIRDHDRASFESREKTLRHIEKILNEKYGAGTVKLEITEQYRNMSEMIEPCMHLIDLAGEAIKDLGMTPAVPPVRGGTDGAHLSFMGLPCPNLGTAGNACHGPYEHVSAEGMDLCVKVILGIIGKYAEAGEIRK